MLELPESRLLAEQITQTLAGRTIVSAQANASPHKFAWFYGDPALYAALLPECEILNAQAYGSMVQVNLSRQLMLVFGDGTGLRCYAPEEKLPKKHQLLLELDDGSHFVCTVQMYGAIWACPPNGLDDNIYYAGAKAKPAPFAHAFDAAYFAALFDPETEKLSMKAFLATKQRIPGLGNGVLQDILFNAGLHPKCKVKDVPQAERERLYHTVKDTLVNMYKQGGRDVEKNLFGQAGGYKTILSKNTVGMPCPRCGGLIEKAAYLGGAIYYCAGCQREC